jgi:hypothetical protein
LLISKRQITGIPGRVISILLILNYVVFLFMMAMPAPFENLLSVDEEETGGSGSQNLAPGILCVAVNMIALILLSFALVLFLRAKKAEYAFIGGIAAFIAPSFWLLIGAPMEYVVLAFVLPTVTILYLVRWVFFRI